MKLKIFLLIIILSSFVFAQENVYDSINVKVNIDSSINIEKESNYKIEYLIVNMIFKPHSYYLQDATSIFYSSPKGKELDEGIWEFNEYYENINYGVESLINSKIKKYYIDKKVLYPNNFDQDEYTKSTETINSDDLQIKRQAELIAGNKDDLYEIVFDIGEWVNQEIDYSLNSLTEELNQDASWTFQNRYGVCDEITTLFVAMVRSIGIPAKFVSGVAYTDKIDNFGNHAWAEVYFPEYGWIPFDVTYGQYGFVDSTHIKMRESNDPKEPSISYKWKARGIELNAGEVNTKTEIILRGNKYNENLDIEIYLPEEEYGIGSYIPAVVKVHNLDKYYRSSGIYISKSPIIMNDTRQNFLLRPNETIFLSYIVGLEENSDNKFEYSSEIEVKTIFDKSVSEKIKYSKDYSYYSEEDAKDYINNFEFYYNEIQETVYMNETIKEEPKVEIEESSNNKLMFFIFSLAFIVFVLILMIFIKRN